jgi:hypothetical protein
VGIPKGYLLKEFIFEKITLDLNLGVKIGNGYTNK